MRAGGPKHVSTQTTRRNSNRKTRKAFGYLRTSPNIWGRPGRLLKLLRRAGTGKPRLAGQVSACPRSMGFPETLWPTCPDATSYARSELPQSLFENPSSQGDHAVRVGALARVPATRHEPDRRSLDHPKST